MSTDTHDEGDQSQQVFLQAVLASQFLPENLLEQVTNTLNQRVPEAEQTPLEERVVRANEVLDAVDMELLRVRNDFEAGAYYYILLNKTPLAPGADRRFLTPPQAAQFKDILDIMFADSQCEGITPASDLPLDRFPSRDDIVDKLVQQRWLEDLPDNDGSRARRVFISVRCLHEMQPYLAERYGGRTMHRCIGCEQWFLAGRLCTNSACDARLHGRCYEAYFRSRGEEGGACSKCGSAI